MLRCDRRTAVSWLAALLVLAASGMASASDAPPTIEEMMDVLEVSKAEKRELEAGGVVVRTLQQDVQHQIPTLVMFRLPIALDQVMETYADGKAMQAVRRHIALGRPSLPIDESEWEGVRFDPSEAEEIELLLEATPSVDLNLSTEEYASLREQLGDVSDEDRIDAVSAAYRRILQERFRAYATGGLEAIQPYDQGAGQFTDPAQEILVEWKASRPILVERFPDFVAAVESFPREQPESVVNQFFWVKEDFTSKFSSRAAFELEHQAWHQTDDYIVVSTRQYFVAHTYTAQQINTVVLPDRDGVVIFSVTAVASDLVARYVPMIAVPIGKKIMRAEMQEYFQSLIEAARP